MEPFISNNIPVLFLNMHVDEMIFKNIGKFKNKYRFLNIETETEEINKVLSSF